MKKTLLLLCCPIWLYAQTAPSVEPHPAPQPVQCMQAAPQPGSPPPKNTKPYPVSATTSSTNNVLGTMATQYEPPSVTLTNPEKPLSPPIQDKTIVLALDKALVFLSDTTQLLDYRSYTLVNYLHRKFGLKQVYPPTKH